MLFVILPALAGSSTPSPAYAILEARRALRGDDLLTARRLAEGALEVPGAHDQEAAWLVGLTWQYEGEPQAALRSFEAALSLQPEGAFTHRIALSRAEATADAGDPRAALKLLRRERRTRDLDEEQAARFDLDRAMWRLTLLSPADRDARTHGRRLRRETQALVERLDRTPDSVATWHQARAHTQLASLWLDVADELGVGEPTLERRALLVTRAREQLDATVALGQHRFALEQLHRLGMSFERLGDDVVTQYGMPASLTPEARERVENVWVRAHRYYDLAERHAARTARVAEADLYASAAERVEQKVAIL
ncbi:MAG: hypothetical protein H6736_14945 [Alphaproteobacteria bacterium]|nr:hypothetical protein [Alphaproteobacteria bacterium]MCB9693105.1 hypothetical protein [Alphaproteobacteria bacterium]